MNGEPAVLPERDSGPGRRDSHQGPQVVVVGSANVDLVVQVERRPDAGETVLGSDLVRHAGGKGANQAAAAARLGSRTALVARVGADADGEFLTQALQRAGVDTGCVLAGDDRTGIAMILVDADGDNSIVVSPGANARLDARQLREAADVIRGAGVVLAQLEVPLDSVLALPALLAADARLVLNPSPAQPIPPELLAACDPLVVNEHEARIVLGDGAPVEPAEQVRALITAGARSVVITLGGRGAIAAEAAEGSTEVAMIEMSGRDVRVVDTTGAGDAFAGALAAWLATGGTLRDAVDFATRAGALAVQHEGAQSAYAAFAEAGLQLPRPGAAQR